MPNLNAAHGGIVTGLSGELGFNLRNSATSNLSHPTLDDFAGRIRPHGRERAMVKWSLTAKCESVSPKRKRREVFVYLDNDAKVCAPFDAKGLCERVSKLLAE
jgi:hypothetical protein